MRMAVAQLDVGTDKAANRAAARDVVSRAAADGAGLVVLPEYAMWWHPGPDAATIRSTSEGLDGPFVGELTRAANQSGVAVVAGMTERIAGSALPANTLVAVNQHGELVGAYRKVHLYDAFGDRESERLARGEPEAVIVAVGDLRVGLMTCYDLRFPEMARYLVDAGADVLAVPAAWMAGPGKADHWEILARARAIENTAYVLAAGQCGDRRTGRSLAVDPSGQVLARLGEGPGVAAADVDADVVAEVRRRNPSLLNRRFSVVPAGSSA